MKLFLDSSALAKRYLKEPGSDIVADYCAKADEIILSVLSVAEVLSSLNRILREKGITKTKYKKLKEMLFGDVEEASIVAFDDILLRQLIYVLERVSVKTLDGLQIASAILVGADLFLTADIKQSKAIKSLGLPAVLVSQFH